MRYFVAGLALFFLTPIVHAQDTAYNSFGVPEVVIKEIAAPETNVAQKQTLVDCNQKELLEQVRQKIAEFDVPADEESIMDRRSKILALKNINNFQEIEAAAFTPKESYAVANRLIYLKINEGKKDADFNICVSTNPVLARKIYLLMYQTQDGTKVEIINYLKSGQSSDPYFIYKKS